MNHAVMKLCLARLSQTLILAATSLLAFNADAVNPPDTVTTPKGLNLGSTSFFDGFGRQTPGWTLLQYGRYEDVNQIDGATGQANPLFSKPRIRVFVSLTQFSYTTDWHPFGGTFAFSAALPVVDYLRSDFAADSKVRLTNNATNVGDLVWGPTYQSPVVTREGHPWFVWRAQLLVSSPTGALNGNHGLNQGVGYWAANPYLSFTFMPSERWEFSNRINYQYNFPGNKFSSPPTLPGLVYRNGQAGQLIYDNFAASYGVSQRLDVGIAGFYLDQLSLDKTNGIDVRGSIRRDLYAGPGLHCVLDGDNLINLNSYFKLLSENDSAGMKLSVQYIHRF
jgi:hypothetical protein